MRGGPRPSGAAAANRVVMPGPPYQLSATPWRLRGPAPTLGQHNAEIYAELGIGPADLAHLRAAGVL